MREREKERRENKREEKKNKLEAGVFGKGIIL